VVDAATIDRINILQAAMLAMRTAVEGLAGAGLQADHLLIDGNRWEGWQTFSRSQDYSTVQ
jgi:ribonuclease HII